MNGVKVLIEAEWPLAETIPANTVLHQRCTDTSSVLCHEYGHAQLHRMHAEAW